MGIMKLQAYCSDGKTPDGDPILLDEAIGSMSGTLAGTVSFHSDDETDSEDEGTDKENEGTDKENDRSDFQVDDNAIPIFNVNHRVLTRIVEWMTYHYYHKNHPPSSQLDESGKKWLFRSWDRKFLDVPVKHLLELLTAANYMDLKELYDLASKSIANTMEGKNPTEVQTQFGIKNDYTPSELAKLREDYSWME